MLMFCLIQTHRFPSWKQRRENYDLIQLFQKWPLEKSRKQKCFENGLYVQMHMENTLLSTAGFLEPLVLPWTLWFSVGNGSLMQGIPQPLFSHIRMVPEGPGILLYKVLTVVSGLLPLWKYFFLFQTQCVFLYSAWVCVSNGTWPTPLLSPPVGRGQGPSAAVQEGYARASCAALASERGLLATGDWRPRQARLLFRFFSVGVKHCCI